MSAPLAVRLARLALERPRKRRAYGRMAAGLQLQDLLGRRSPGTFRRRRADRVPPPLVVTAKLTDRCDLRCPACFQWGTVGAYHNAPTRSERPTRFWTELVDRIAAFRPFLYLYGGEPLLRGDLAELVARASARGVPTGMNTNGLSLAGRAPELVRAGIDLVMISLDGRREEHDAARGSGTYDRTAAGIEALLAERSRQGRAGPLVSVSTLVTRFNHRSLPALARRVARWRPDLWTLQLPVFTTPELLERGRRLYRVDLGTDPDHWSGYLADHSDWDLPALERGLAEIEARRWPFALRRHPAGGDGFDLGDYFLRPDEPMGRRRCWYAWTHTQVMPDGDLVTCADAPDYVAGSLARDDLLALWNGARYRRFRSALLDRGRYPFCSRCWGLGAVRPRGDRG